MVGWRQLRSGRKGQRSGSWFRWLWIWSWSWRKCLEQHTHTQPATAPTNVQSAQQRRTILPPNLRISTNPHASPGWMDYRHNKIMHSNAATAYHQSPYVSTNPNPQLPPQTPRSFSNAGPSYPQTPYISQNPNNPGDRMNNTHIHTLTCKPLDSQATQDYHNPQPPTFP